MPFSGEQLSGTEASPSRSPEGELAEQDPILEYRRLSMLLSLFTELNNEGQHGTAQSSEPFIASPAEASAYRVPLNAITTLLARHHDIVAVTAVPAPISNVALGSGSNMSHPASKVQIVVMQESHSIPQATDITLTPNPPLRSGLPSVSKDIPEVVIVPRGTSSWQVVSAEPWSQL